MSDPYGAAGSSPLAPLHIVTVPFALLWAGFRAIFTTGPGQRVSPFWGMVLCLFVTCLVVAGIAIISMARTDFDQRADTLVFVSETLWYGKIDAWRVPRFFQTQWEDAYATIRYQAAAMQTPGQWRSYHGSWWQHQEYWTLLVVTGLRYGIVVAGIYLVWSLGRRLLSAGEGYV